LTVPYNYVIRLIAIRASHTVVSTPVSGELADFIANANFHDFAPESVKEAKRRLIDSFGVMLAALDAPPALVARKIAERWPSPNGATVLGSRERANPHYASFANGVLVRYLDFNDTYLSREAIHPSDIIPALIAAGECYQVSGEDLLRGILVGYEVACAMSDAATLRDRGFDHVSNIALGSAAGVSSLLGLDAKKAEEAVNIAATHAAALRQTRVGELSMWKGCAASFAASIGLYAALLASEGMTGPRPVFEGELGYMKAVSGPFTMPKLTRNAARILRTSIKWWPVEYHSMSAVECILKIGEALGEIKPSDVEQILVKTFTVAYKIIVKDREKWRPRSRETADHSLPYIVARGLLDNYIWLDSFKEPKLVDPSVLELMEKMRIEVDPRYDETYPNAVGTSITIVLRDGRRLSEEVLYPKGHFMNPLSDEELYNKFHRLSEGALGEEAKDLWERVLTLERLKNLEPLLSPLRGVSGYSKA
jgi:2-methylcitrate dehydratase